MHHAYSGTNEFSEDDDFQPITCFYTSRPKQEAKVNVRKRNRGKSAVTITATATTTTTTTAAATKQKRIKLTETQQHAAMIKSRQDQGAPNGLPSLDGISNCFGDQQQPIESEKNIKDPSNGIQREQRGDRSPEIHLPDDKDPMRSGVIPRQDPCQCDCPVCGTDMSSLELPMREHHVNQCLDTFDSPTLTPTAETTNHSREKESTHPLEPSTHCPCCRSIWNSKTGTFDKRMRHLQKCAKQHRLPLNHLLSLLTPTSLIPSRQAVPSEEGPLVDAPTAPTDTRSNLNGDDRSHSKTKSLPARLAKPSVIHFLCEADEEDFAPVLNTVILNPPAIMPNSSRARSNSSCRDESLQLGLAMSASLVRTKPKADRRKRERQQQQQQNSSDVLCVEAALQIIHQRAASVLLECLATSNKPTICPAKMTREHGWPKPQAWLLASGVEPVDSVLYKTAILDHVRCQK